MRIVNIIVVILMGAASGCEGPLDWSNAPVCYPGVQRNCNLPTGELGVQICDNSGRGYEDCVRGDAAYPDVTDATVSPEDVVGLDDGLPDTPVADASDDLAQVDAAADAGE